MNTLAKHRLDRARRLLVTGAVVGSGVAVILGVLSPAAVVPAYRFVAFACLSPALGSMIFALIHRTTGGRWGDALAPFLAAGCRLAPWIWTLVLLLVFFAPDSATRWPDYGSRAMLALRGGIGAALLFALSIPLGRKRTAGTAWVGPVGLIVLVFTLHILADDWLVALEPGWHSTAFPVVWMSGQAVAGLAVAILAALVCGGSPREGHGESRALGLDWGNLLLATLVFWCYVAFAQFLIIWAGNLPREIAWFVRRSHGFWAAVPLLLLAIHFVLPLAVLLSRTFKRSAIMLGLVAFTLVVAQVLYLAWLILPGFPRFDWAGDGLAFALVGSALALFFHRYLAGAEGRLERS